MRLADFGAFLHEIFKLFSNKQYSIKLYCKRRNIRVTFILVDQDQNKEINNA